MDVEARGPRARADHVFAELPQAHKSQLPQVLTAASLLSRLAPAHDDHEKQAGEKQHRNRYSDDLQDASNHDDRVKVLAQFSRGPNSAIADLCRVGTAFHGRGVPLLAGKGIWAEIPLWE